MSIDFKKEISPLVSVLSLLFSAFLLLGYLFLMLYQSGFLPDFILYFYGPPEREERISLHLYNDESTSINNVLVRVYYLVPQDQTDKIIENWKEVFNESLKRASQFFELQFGYNMKMYYRFYPEIIYSEDSLEYFNALLVQDYERERITPHSQSLLIGEILNQVGDRVEQAGRWGLSKKRLDGSYIINLFVLNSQPSGLEGVERLLLGLNDEKNNSVVMSYIFLDEDFRGFHESVICHEVGHGLGIPEFYILFDERIMSYGVMGEGLTKSLEYNYLQSSIKNKMGY